MEPNPGVGRLESMDVPLAEITDTPALGFTAGTLPEPDSSDSRMTQDVSTASNMSPAPLVFDDFYREHAGPIGHALTVTLDDTELAEDALNEAMARALQRWKRVSRFHNAPGWVYRVALNWALSWKRRRRRERERPMILELTTAGIEPADEQLAAALAGLSVEHRAVVVCRYMLDWSTAQTAEALSIAEGTVKSRLARALDAIRRTLEVPS